MRGRPAGVALIVLGAILGALPAFSWYAAPVGEAEVRASGFAGAGQLALLPVLGALVAIMGVAVVLARPADRGAAAARAGVVAAAAGLLAMAFSLWAAAAPRVSLEASLAGGREVVPSRIDLEPAALVAPALAAALALLGGAMAWASRRG